MRNVDQQFNQVVRDFPLSLPTERSQKRIADCQRVAPQLPRPFKPRASLEYKIEIRRIVNLCTGQAYRRAVRVESGEDTMPDFPPSETPEWTSGRDGEREILRTAMRGLAEDLGIDADSMDDELDAMLDEEFAEKRERTPDRRECQSIYRQK